MHSTQTALCQYKHFSRGIKLLSHRLRTCSYISSYSADSFQFRATFELCEVKDLPKSHLIAVSETNNIGLTEIMMISLLKINRAVREKVCAISNLF